MSFGVVPRFFDPSDPSAISRRGSSTVASCEALDFGTFEHEQWTWPSLGNLGWLNLPVAVRLLNVPSGIGVTYSGDLIILRRGCMIQQTSYQWYQSVVLTSRIPWYLDWMRCGEVNWGHSDPESGARTWEMQRAALALLMVRHPSNKSPLPNSCTSRRRLKWIPSISTTPTHACGSQLQPRLLRRATYVPWGGGSWLEGLSQSPQRATSKRWQCFEPDQSQTGGETNSTLGST